MNIQTIERLQEQNRRMAKTIEQKDKRIEKLEAALESIEETLDAHMGEWSSVDLTYLPPEMAALYDLREQLRAAITQAKLVQSS